MLSRAGMVVALTIAIAVGFATQIPKLQADFTPSDLFAAFEDQEQIAAEFRQTFGNTDNVVLVLLEGEDVLDGASLTTTWELVQALKALPDVQRVEALTTLSTSQRAQQQETARPNQETSVTNAYFDLYDMSADLVRGVGSAAASLGGEDDDDAGADAQEEDTEQPPDAPSNEVTENNAQTSEDAEAQPAEVELEATAERSSVGAQNAPSMRQIVGGPTVSDSQAEMIKEFVDAQGLVRNRLVSEDGTLSAIAVFLKPERLKNDQIAESVGEIEDAIGLVNPPDGERLLLGGLPYIRKTVVDNLKADQTILLPAAIFVSLLILFIAFRWWAAMVLPTIAVAASALVLVGGMAIVGEPFNILNNVVPTLVIVIGISDSIHVISRYRDGIGLGAVRREAALDALKTMTLACFLTSFTTAVGFLSLGISETVILQHFGVTAAIGVMIAYVITIAFVPTALTLVPAPSKGAIQSDHGAIDQVIENVTRGVIRYRYAVLIVAALVMASAIWVGRTIKIDSAVLDQVNANSQVYKTTRLIEEKLGGLRPLEFFIRADDDASLTQPDVIAATRELIEWGREQQGVLGSLSFTDFLGQARRVATGDADLSAPFDDQRQTRALYNLLTSQNDRNPLKNYLVDDATVGRATLTISDMGARSTNELITEAEAKVDELFGPIEGVHVRITGDAFSGSRGLDAIITDLIWSLSTAVIIIFVFLVILFRSLRLGLLSIPPNLLPLAITLGYMTLRGVPLNTATAIIFSISIGLAVDGTIHYLARFREELRADGDVEEALVRSARGTGKAILVTCVALIVGFGVMLISQFVPIRRFGELIAITVFGMLLATTLVLPALVRVGYGATKDVSKSSGDPSDGGSLA